MSDPLTPEQRSWTMSRVRSKNTKPELIVRSMLHRCGYRFRVNREDLPGKPDIVLRKYRTAIFVHGCFWHRHPGCKHATMPATRMEYWRAKFDRNVQRDGRNLRLLRKAGWRVIVVWECQVMRNPRAVLQRIIRLLGNQRGTHFYKLPPKRELLKAAERRLRYSLAKDEPAQSERK